MDSSDRLKRADIVGGGKGARLFGRVWYESGTMRRNVCGDVPSEMGVWKRSVVEGGS